MRQLFIPLSKAFGLYMIYTGLCYAFTVFPMIIYQLSSPEDPVMGMTMVKVFGIGVPATGISFAAVLALKLIAFKNFKTKFVTYSFALRLLIFLC